jgi:myo-inositol-1(or 4)-monophosphatase
MAELLQPYFDFIVETAYLAGRSTLGYFQTGVQVQLKNDHSPVTIADRQAEMLIRGRIEERYPQHAIIGEEAGVKESAGATHRWIIDPIDGTKSFTRGVPLYGVLIGLEIEGRVEVGAAYFPALSEMVAAASGLGCWWNGRRAQVSPVADLKQAYLSCTDPGAFRKHGRQEAYERLSRAVYFRTGWGDAYGYACVATGRAEAMLDPVMSIWDCGPFPVIFREAGGYFGDWQGNETICAQEALATNQALRAPILELLNGE